ncbi:Rpn family recombination-promoting nuclease/putative transposase [Treponema socranskii]|uniref:Rpn family recombination-promoting nuclease/putative transposase n=1 Tax=Treponema socranskii TaxID=53419 RepID=UPI003D8BAA78
MNTSNRKYKDSVFVDLFSEDEKAKENFLSLYNALHGTNPPLSSPVENIRLDNVMYMNIINDVSCPVDGKISVLAEHQSTINENMPLRFLEYIARLYEKLQAPTDRYLRKPSKIPAPEFYAFYNGIEDYPETTVLKLSDAFITKPEQMPLELTVQVLNINTDKANTDIVVQREESLRIGIQQGFSDGAYQKALETARLMKQANCEIPFIAKMPGLTKEEVKSIS